MITLRIQRKMVIEKWGVFMNRFYCASSRYVVQRRVLWFFWVDLHEDESERMAQSWLDAYRETFKKATN